MLFFRKSLKIISRGFTLIETIVTVFIVVILTTAFLANFRAGERRYALEQGRQQIIADIRRAQNMALSGREAIAGGTIYMYGLNFFLSQPAQYIIFGDKDNSKTYTAGDRVFASQILPAKIKIKNLTPNPFDVVFEPPDPTVYLNGARPATGTIILEVEGTDLTRTITINTFGLVE